MKVAFHTLGCKVKHYESEAMAGHFRAAGYEIVDERDFADVYIINTCTVTAVADKKSRQYIRRMKKVNPDSVIAVTGCYAQISPEEVAAVDGVDIVTGTNEKHRLTDYVAEFMDNGIKQLHIKGYEELDSYEDVGTETFWSQLYHRESNDANLRMNGTCHLAPEKRNTKAWWGLWQTESCLKGAATVSSSRLPPYRAVGLELPDLSRKAREPGKGKTHCFLW